MPLLSNSRAAGGMSPITLNRVGQGPSLIPNPARRPRHPRHLRQTRRAKPKRTRREAAVPEIPKNRPRRGRHAYACPATQSRSYRLRGCSNPVFPIYTEDFHRLGFSLYGKRIERGENKLLVVEISSRYLGDDDLSRRRIRH